MERIKFYSANDLMCGQNLKNSEKKIKDYGSGDKELQDINDMIELYNIKMYFDTEIFLLDWTPEIIKRFEEIINNNFWIVAKFFKSVDNDNFVRNYNDTALEYKNDFWGLLEKFKAYKNISEENFLDFMNTCRVSLHEILICKNVTNHFGGIIREIMLNDELSAEILLNKYEVQHMRISDPVFLPKELSNSDKETIICKYIDSEDPNLNYLRLIANIQSSKDNLELSPKTLLKSKRKSEELEKQYFKESSGLEMETSVSFSASQDEEAFVNIDGQSISATYSTKWIEYNADYATLLNNFIYLFEFVDLHMRCTLVNKTNEMGVFERFIFTTSQNAYNKGIGFDRKDILSLLQMTSYYNQLSSIGIRLEEVIEWFFEVYLPIEFSASNFKVTMPSKKSTYLEKCNSIMPALEAVLKQFTLYIEDGQIDSELLEIRSDHLIYKNIPSFLDKKYAYGVGDEYRSATFLLFSDQTSLNYLKKTGKSYSNFFEIVSIEKIKLSDFPQYNVSKIDWLINHKFLSIDKEDYIVFHNDLLILILKDMYMNDVAIYWKYTNYGRSIMDELQARNIIEFESSLFSRPEQDYINFLLNKSQFNNGLDLRNRYSHAQPNSVKDERTHNHNYLIFLRLFIIAVIKINDDFCTSVELREKV